MIPKCKLKYHFQYKKSLQTGAEDNTTDDVIFCFLLENNSINRNDLKEQREKDWEKKNKNKQEVRPTLRVIRSMSSMTVTSLPVNG